MILSPPPKEDTIMDPKQNLIQRIIAQINTSINNYAANKMTTSYNYDRAQVNYKMQEIGYKTVGEYARANLFKILFSKSY